MIVSLIALLERIYRENYIYNELHTHTHTFNKLFNIKQCTKHAKMYV